ncbi:MAG: OB-fold protein [Flavobacteriales bacterium]
MLRKIIGILLALALVGGGIAYYLWNKPHKTAEGAKPIATLTADALIAEYAANTATADTKYLDKVVEVSGTVSDASTNELGRQKITLSTSHTDELGLPAGITFIMKENEIVPQATVGINVVLKGICTGYNTDVQFKEAVSVTK